MLRMTGQGVGSNVRKIYYLSGAIFIDNSNANDSLYYVYSDNQGSVIALTDESGNVKRKYAYDPWGDRRNPVDWTQKDNGGNLIINRGYTGHEHLDAFGIINMNGRVYDPATAMFFSPDPFLQDPESWLNYNRYSYVQNNPTRYTDPSGYIKCTVEMPAFDPNALRWMSYGSRGSGGGSSLKYWSDHQGKISWNTETDRYEYASGVEATTLEVMNQLNSSAKPEDIVNLDLSVLSGYDHLYIVPVKYKGITSIYIQGSIDGVKSFVAGNTGITVFSSNNGIEKPAGQEGGFLDKGLDYAGKTNDAVDAFAKTIGTNGLTAVMVSGGKTIGRYSGPAGIVISIGQVFNGVRKDGYTYGYNAQKATAGAVGGTVGAWAGFQAGAWAGFEAGFTIGLAFEGVGAIPGAVIGGIVGGFGGAWGGAYGGSKLGESLISNKAQ